MKKEEHMTAEEADALYTAADFHCNNRSMSPEDRELLKRALRKFARGNVIHIQEEED
jgi:hypothetical protein